MPVAEEEAPERQQRHPRIGVEPRNAESPGRSHPQVASSIHALSDPLVAISADIEAGLTLLDKQRPDINEALAIFRRALTNANQAIDIITRARTTTADQGR